MDARQNQRNDPDPMQSLLDGIELDVLDEFLCDKLAEMATNETRPASSNTRTIVGPFTPGNATIFQGDNGVCTPGAPKNVTQLGRLEPQSTISSYSDQIETSGTTSLEKDDNLISGLSSCRNRPLFAVPRFHHAQESSDVEIPSPDQIMSTPALSCFEENWNSHSTEFSSTHQNQKLPTVSSLNFHPAQSTGFQSVDQTEPTVQSSCRETWNSMSVSPHQDQYSYNNASFQHSASSFGISRDSSAETTDTYSYIPPDVSPALRGQWSVGLSPEIRDNYSTFSTTLVAEKLFQCVRCDRKFSRQDQLKIHYYQVHTYAKPFKCDVCGEEFWQECHLYDHHRTHMNGKRPSFGCDRCGKLFSNESTLKCHYRVHTGEKLSECDKCERVFTKKQHLETHYRIHTGEKPFKCDECGKQYTQLNQLKNHYRIHWRKETSLV